MGTRTIKADLLTPAGFAPYGHVISALSDSSWSSANQNTAKRWNYVAQVENKRPATARANMCVFRSVPASLPFDITLLERHPNSTQAFIPMMGMESRGYLVIVAKNGADDKPDLSTLYVAVASRSQGISYHTGIWHHPMVALESVTDFACLVHETGGEGDTDVEPLDNDIRVVGIEECLNRLDGLRSIDKAKL